MDPTSRVSPNGRGLNVRRLAGDESAVASAPPPTSGRAPHGSPAADSWWRATTIGDDAGDHGEFDFDARISAFYYELSSGKSLLFGCGPPVLPQPERGKGRVDRTRQNHELLAAGGWRRVPNHHRRFGIVSAEE